MDNVPQIQFGDLTDVEKDEGCRVLSRVIRRLLSDPKYRADFEKWKKEREGGKTRAD